MREGNVAAGKLWSPQLEKMWGRVLLTQQTTEVKFPRAVANHRDRVKHLRVNNKAYNLGSVPNWGTAGPGIV